MQTKQKIDADDYPMPENESARLEALYRYNIIDTPEEAVFNRLTGLASRMLDAPIALISLIDANRQWFKSTTGYEGDGSPRAHSFCAHAICENEILCIPDARLDKRFHRNPFVTGTAQIRFYAGAPLTTHDGYRLGTLCVIDQSPRPPLNDKARAILEDLAAIAMALIEQRIEHRLRKRAEQEIAEKANEAEVVRRRFEETLNTISQGISVFDSEFNLRFANPSLLWLQDLPEQFSEPGRAFADFIRYHAEQGEYGAGAEAEGKIAELTALARDPKGSVLLSRRKNGRMLEVRTLPLSDGGFVTTHTDITEIKQNERMKDEFISTVSHELRTPLAAITGALSLIETEPLPPGAAHLCSLAAKNAVRLTQLINDVLDIERRACGRLMLNREPVDIVELIQQSIEALAPYGKNYGVTYEFTPDACGVTVDADPDRITQVLTNLLSNAAKFSPPGETVVVSLGRDQQMLRVTVADRGCGIPEIFQSRIFGKFAQANSSAARKGGAGLGLNIARMLVEAHQGAIGYQERAEGGTIFWFDLPLVQPLTN